MKNGYLKSSPAFFRLIKRSALAGGLLLLLLAALLPAPLQEPANPAVTPNPARSAWFLLWIQELVSWTKLTVYPALLLGLLFLLLPWLPAKRRPHRARWFPREQRGVNLMTIFFMILITALTVVAAFFRGADWQLRF